MKLIAAKGLSMSKTPLATVEQVWFNKHEAAEYMRRLGFREYTANSVKTAARTGKLHAGQQHQGKPYYWRKEWLDDWANGGGESLDDNAIDEPANNWEE